MPMAVLRLPGIRIAVYKETSQKVGHAERTQFQKLKTKTNIGKDVIVVTPETSEVLS